ncbi:glucosamine-6-phosphate deaminase [Flammeovirgaceae bacterium 311]|nr:glucosamine-6-phosphate deaminase [Flammeovirgaceae bacterium 311]
MKEITKEKLKVRIFNTRSQMGADAAEVVSEKIRELLQHKEFINIVFAAAPSQNEFLTSLRDKDVDWRRVNAFHMDEYVGLDSSAPQLFGNYLREKLFDKVSFREVYYLGGDPEKLDEECDKYTRLLEKYPTDIVILGIGENTHLAFNDPHVADFNDPKMVKIVDLDEKNRNQQVDPKDPICFDTLEEVPTHAITLTIPALFKATYAYAVVPGKNKADAIYHTLNEEIQERYPSTLLREHPNAILYIDQDSASRLTL